MDDLMPTGDDSPKPFYKRWWFIALAVVFALGIIGSNTDTDPNSTVLAAESTTTSTETEQSTTTSTTPPTTAQVATTTTTQAATTTTESTLSDADERAIFGVVFDGQRLELASLFEEEIFHIESVDVLQYDPDSGTIQMAMTSAFPSLLPQDLPDDGWDIMQAWKAYFTSFVSSAGSDFGIEVVPNIEVDLSGHAFHCPADFVLDMIDLRVSQSDFVRICIEG